MPKLQLTSITIGTPHPHELAMFYARLLDGTITADETAGPGEPETAGWAQVRTMNETGRITLNFEYERAWQPPVWPSEPGKQHITQHLDVWVDDLEAAVAWAEECGAVQDPHQFQDGVRVMRDPHGHPFCLFVHGE